jgi:hypothetical protein
MPGNAGAIGGRRSANTTVAGGIWDLTTQQQERGASNWTGAFALGTSQNPASSATAIRNSGNTTNGAYWYQIPGGSLVELYTDFTTWSSYSFVLINRLSSADHLQYLTTANFATDLTVANTTAPTRSAKISDTDYNIITVADTVKWVIGGNKQIFYRHNDSWTSNFGQVGSCSYTTAYFSNAATPSNSPSWTNFSGYNGACGGGQISSEWGILTGIHANDANYKGTYIGQAAILSTAPAGYTTSTATGWGVPGYAFLSW